MPARFVAGDEVYGNDSKLRTALRQRSVGFVLAVACDHRLPTAGGRVPAARLAVGLSRRSWQRPFAGAGVKGPRYYRGAWFKIDDEQPGCHWLLVRRNDSTGELAYYPC
ncbi:MAG: IS701 family transposase, partial [Actinomycetota bacterium]|nr:IS701 family transposase [Actinomycetota bacterium]